MKMLSDLVLELVGCHGRQRTLLLQPDTRAGAEKPTTLANNLAERMEVVSVPTNLHERAAHSLECAVVDDRVALIANLYQQDIK
jgi:hypothetical protein